MLAPPGRQGGQLGWAPPGVLLRSHIQAGSPGAQPWHWSWGPRALAASVLPPGSPLDMGGLPHPHFPCTGTESAEEQETCWVSAQTRCVCTSMHAHEQQEGVREVSPSPTLSPLGWAGSKRDSLGDITTFTIWQTSCTWVSSCCIPHSASASLLLQQREGQSGLQGSPLHRGTPFLSTLTLSCSHSHLPQSWYLLLSPP